MALSSYENLGYTNEMKICSGIQIDDWKFELYKNWIYISNPKIWNKDSFYQEPTVGCISGENNGNIMGINIHTIKGPQTSTICLIANKDYTKFFFGIAAYGYQSEVPGLIKYGKKLGKRIPSEKKGWIPFAISSDSDGSYGVMFENKKKPDLGFRTLKFTLKELPKRLQNAKYIGIAKSTFKFALNWLMEEFRWEDKIKGFVEKLKKVRMKSYNAGDLFFNKAGIDVDPVTDMAKTKKPLLVKAIDKMKPNRGKKSNSKALVKA